MTGRRRRTKGPSRLDRLAEDLLGPVVARAGFSSTQILAAWPEIVGPELAARSRPEKLRWPPRRDTEEGPETADRATPASTTRADAATLVVRAEGGDALEIQHLSDRIIARINALFGWRAVARIAIRQAPVADPQADTAPRPIGNSAGGEPRHSETLDAALARLGSHIGGGENTKP